MAWTKTSVSKDKVLKLSESYTLPASATVGYSSVIEDFFPDYNKTNKYITASFKASAISGTNLDIALYGCDADGSNPVLLKDAVVADITTTALIAGTVDLNAYPYEAYKLGWTADANESANTIAVSVYG